jgi:hypothetical protein
MILDFGLRSTEREATGSAPESHSLQAATPGASGAALRHLAFALPFVALPLLDLYALFGAIVPQLAR